MKLSIEHVLAGLGAILLVLTQNFAVAMVAGWTLSGLFSLSRPFEIALIVIVFLAALVATWWFARSVYAVEPFFVRKEKTIVSQAGPSGV